MNTMILVNPKAREGAVGKNWPDLQHQLLGALGEGKARVEFTTDVDYGAGMVRKALKDGVERILVVGGDGSISEAVQGFFENGKPVSPDATVMVMPAGRGDDFFKSMVGRRCSSTADAWKQGLELLKHGKSEPVDLGRLSWLPHKAGVAAGASFDRAFVNVASFGYSGLVVQRVMQQSGALGRTRVGKSGWAYLLQIATGLMEYKPLPVEVRVDGESVFDGPLFCGFVLNGSYNAGGIRWSDEARIDDGLFHVVVSEPRDALSTVLSGPRMLSGDWKNVKGVHRFKGRRVEVRAHPDGKRDYPLFDIDGDQPEKPGTDGAVFEVMPGVVRLWR
jgi:diacylglycerol kinase (ATP)